jgi:leader peptidase (prepilin peptidase)/N-methyltransferase
MLETAMFLLGLIFGSFLNVCIYRLPRDLSVLRPARSFCPHCDRTIAWYDNLPILSYLLLGGRCRNCGARIPLRYLLVELLTGISWAAIAHAFGSSPMAAKYFLFSALMIGLLFADLEERILPDEMTLGGLAAGLVFAWMVPLEGLFGLLFLPADWGPRAHSLAEAGFAAALSSGSMWLLGAVYQRVRHREGLGLGDVKMVAMMGAFLGVREVLLALIAGSVLGSVIGLVYIFATGKDSKTYELPFGTFLAIGGLAVALGMALKIG